MLQDKWQEQDNHMQEKTTRIKAQNSAGLDRADRTKISTYPDAKKARTNDFVRRNRQEKMNNKDDDNTAFLAAQFEIE